MESVRAAFDGGFEGVEIDVRLTRDERVILAHDADLRRAASGGPNDGLDWRFRDHTWAELAQVALPYANHLLPALPPTGISEADLYELLELRQRGRDSRHPHEGERLADGRIAHPVLFEDVLSWILEQRSSFLIEVECKEPRLAEPLFDVFQRIGGADRCILFSGEPRIIEEIAHFYRQDRRPSGLRIGANIRRLSPEWLERIAELKLDVVDLNAFEAERADVRRLVAEGLAVLSNLGDLPPWWEILNEWEFAGFKTNFPEEYTSWWEGRATAAGGG